MGREVLIIGSSQAGLQTALDLADSGIKVHLVEPMPFMGKKGEDLFPDYLANVRSLEILKHPHISTWTNTEIKELTREDGRFQAVLQQYPRYIDISKCTACGACIDICPITVPGTDRKAINLGGQPDCAVIEKGGISPCTNACPAGIHVQGYVALIAQNRYREAYELIHSALPFPSVCGRVCNHYCEQACTRSQLDEAVNLMALKRFVSDWAYEHQAELKSTGKKSLLHKTDPVQNTGKKIAVIGSGPAGLTAARDLVRKGHAVTVFDNNPKAGGMMRVAIPPHRLPYQQLDWEIEQILSEGVDLQLNTWVDDIPGLFTKGYSAVLIATGANEAVKMPIEGADHSDNWLSLDFLKKACLGESIDLKGRKVVILGGGDVAMDAARVAIRLGPSDVRVVCRGMRASFNEIQEAEEEGVEIIRGKVFQRVILKNGNISGVECLEAEVGEVVNGKRQFNELPGTEHLIPGDLVIWALGQKPDFSFLPQDDRISILSPQGISADTRMMTTLEGVFTAGDVRRGTTFFVVDAVGEGHQAAESIDCFLSGEPFEQQKPLCPEVTLSRETMLARIEQRKSARNKRSLIPHLPVNERENNFKEVDLTLGEKAALSEAGRCLICGPCSECMACVEVCEPGAIIHAQNTSSTGLDIDGVIIADDNTIDLENLKPYRITGDGLQAGSAAAFQVMRDLGISHTDPFTYPSPATFLKDKPDRIGLVLCQCGGEISRYLDTQALGEEAANWPGIVHTQELPFSCSGEAAESIRDIISTNDLEKLILAACACCSLDQVCFSCTYQRLRCKENLGLFSSLKNNPVIEFINIREQCAWVHKENRAEATESAKTLIKSTLARLRNQPRIITQPAVEFKKVLILGTGPAGEVCRSSLDQLGIPSQVAEDIPTELLRLGGHFNIQNQTQQTQADLLALAPLDSEEQQELFNVLKMPGDRNLLPLSSHQINSLDFGVVICPPEMDPGISGMAAAARIKAWLSRLNHKELELAAVVDSSRCRACGTCLEVCGFGIPELVEVTFGRVSRIDPRLCLGCGICAAHCPSGAILSGITTETQLEEILEAILT
jgi:NADPH-dependent glutamate synthase beta subunit-like oxidoreductase/NAD-dependent dihydropyrimidine dehydrogenase PreA subunit